MCGYNVKKQADNVNQKLFATPQTLWQYQQAKRGCLFIAMQRK